MKKFISKATVTHLPLTLHDIPILMVAFALPFFRAFSNIAIGFIIFLSLVNILSKRRIPTTRFYWFFPTLFLYYLISELLSGGQVASLEKRLLFIFVPLIFTLNVDYLRNTLRDKIYLSFIAGNAIAILICIVRAVTRSVTFMNGQLVFNAKLYPDTHFSFLTSSVMGGNYFFYREFSYFLDPLYSSLYLVFAQFLVFCVLKSCDKKRHRRWLIAVYLLFMVALFLISSKASIISSLLLSIYIAFYIISNTKTALHKKVFILVGAITCVVIFFFVNPRFRVLKDSFSFTTVLNPDPNTRDGFDLRILSWKASIALIKDHWLFGVGEGQKRDALVEVYKAKRYITPAKELHNSHNQYLDFLVGGGIFGFILHMAGLTQLFVKSKKEANFPLFGFLLLFTFTAVFENLLSRHEGILLFTFFIALMEPKGETLIKSIELKG